MISDEEFLKICANEDTQQLSPPKQFLDRTQFKTFLSDVKQEKQNVLYHSYIDNIEELNRDLRQVQKENENQVSIYMKKRLEQVKNQIARRKNELFTNVRVRSKTIPNSNTQMNNTSSILPQIKQTTTNQIAPFDTTLSEFSSFYIDFEKNVIEKMKKLLKKNYQDNRQVMEYLSYLLKKAQQAQEVINKCNQERQNCYCIKNEIKQKITNYTTIQQQYKQFLQILQQMGYAQNENWHILLGYHFNTIVERNRQFREDFYKFRQQNFEYKISTQQSYFNVDNVRRRQFLAKRRKKDRLFV